MNRTTFEVETAPFVGKRYFFNGYFYDVVELLGRMKADRSVIVARCNSKGREFVFNFKVKG